MKISYYLPLLFFTLSISVNAQEKSSKYEGLKKIETTDDYERSRVFHSNSGYRTGYLQEQNRNDVFDIAIVEEMPMIMEFAEIGVEATVDDLMVLKEIEMVTPLLEVIEMSIDISIDVLDQLEHEWRDAKHHEDHNH